jgi:hypothetical protein
MSAYRRLLQDAGFPAIRILDLAPSYNNYQFVVDSLDRASYRFLRLRGLLSGFYAPARVARGQLAAFAPGLLGALAYSYLVIGGADVTTLLDGEHPFWGETNLRGGVGVHRFACRGMKVGCMLIVEHDGARVSRVVQMGMDSPPPEGPSFVTQIGRRLGSCWTAGPVLSAFGLSVRAYAPS